MGGELETVGHDEGVTRPPSHRRILVLMAAVGVAGSIAGALFVSGQFGIGGLLGSALAFVNYLWLKRSLKTIFDAAAEGQKPRMLAAGYFARYAVLGLIVAAVYIGNIVPIVALILGLAGFGFAVVLEGFIRIFSGIFSSKEI